MTKADSTVVKRSISLSKTVSGWADEQAEKKGFHTNFSAYIADLIRRDKERENPQAEAEVSSQRRSAAGDRIVEAVRSAARTKNVRLRKK
jgi:Arc/MetJ-type ribon-helix-helix transcriptional regulator